MNAIGGYFELELAQGTAQYHHTPYAYKSGRASLHAILHHTKPAQVYIPYYCCEALLNVFAQYGYAYTFYRINERLEPEQLPELREKEYFLYVNYFDCCQNTVDALVQRYQNRLIVDCTQAFFRKGDGQAWYFNSCRKFFGVPDGSYLYVPDGVTMPAVQEANEAYTTAHLIKRFNGHPEAGYADFRQNEAMCESTLAGMSRLTKCLLSGLSYETIRQRRRNNFSFLHAALADINRMKVCTDLADDAEAAPMAYPLWPLSKIDRNRLLAERIFVPTYWPGIVTRNDAACPCENLLAAQVLPLPADHRYTTTDLQRIVDTIKKRQ